MKEVQMFPEDYDGVLAGAAPLELTHLHPYMVQLGIWNLPSTAVGHIPAYKFKLISNFIMEQCDGQDGLVDGIVSEPYRCNFSSTAILCNTTNPETNNCLTEDEVNTLSLFYNDWVATDGSLLYPHFPISASVDAYSEVTNA
jgi:feruloyl esterase